MGTYQFKFEIGDKVEHWNTGMTGHVIGLHRSRSLVELTLVEWRDNNGRIQSDYFPAVELFEPKSAA